MPSLPPQPEEVIHPPFSHRRVDRFYATVRPFLTRPLENVSRRFRSFLSGPRLELPTQALRNFDTSLFSTEQEALQAINLLLGRARHGAIDHETGFHAAALVEMVWRDGRVRYYIDVNIQQPGTEPHERHCAEVRVIKKALSDTKDARVRRLWLMGGLTVRGATPHQETGKRYWPCGACLGLINEIKSGAATTITSLPVNNGHEVVQPPHFSGSRRAEEKVIGELYPHPAVRVSDSDGTLKASMRRALKKLEEASSETELLDLDCLSGLKESDLLAAVSRHLQNSLVRTFQKDPVNITGITAVICRLSDGTYRAMTLAQSRLQPTIIPAEYAVIAAAAHENPNVQMTDIFITQLKPAEVKEQLLSAVVSDPVEIAAPRGDARMRIHKFSVHLPRLNPLVTYADGDPVTPNGARVHLIPFNAGNSFDPKWVVILYIADLLPTPYVHPKQE